MGLLGAKHWLETSGYKPDMFVAADVSSTRSGTGRCASTSSSSSTLRPARTPWKAAARRAQPKPSAEAILALYDIPLPPIAEGLETFKLPVLNVGMLGGGTVVNAIPREAWFTVDLRSLDSATQDRLESAVVSTAKRIGEQEGVGFRMERKMGVDYSKARPQKERLDHPLVQTALATSNYFRKPGTPQILATDVGSCDSNIAISMGIPAVAIGATVERMPHRLEENADAGSIVPGIKSLIALGVALTSH